MFGRTIHLAKHSSSRRLACIALSHLGRKIILIRPFTETSSRLCATSTALDDVICVNGFVVVTLWNQCQ